MIISGKHIDSDEKDIYTKLSALFSNKPYIEVTPLQTDLFDSICGPKKLLGKKLAEYKDQSLSFFIALIKEGEAATVINQQKEIEEIQAPEGSDYFNQAAVINISNDTIYYATIDRLSESDIKYFLQKALDDVQKLMQNDVADMIFTDPPYNVNYGSTMKDSIRYHAGSLGGRKIMNDNLGDGFAQFLTDALRLHHLLRLVQTRLMGLLLKICFVISVPV